MKRMHDYWAQAVVTSFVLVVIGPVIMPDWLAYSLVLMFGVVTSISSIASFLVNSVVSPMPFAGISGAVGIIVGFLMVSLGTYLLFGPGPQEFIFALIDYLASNPRHLCVLGAATISMAIGLGQLFIRS